MAIGDDAAAAGFPLVPETGEEGRVRWGAREFNRTRDLIAQVKKLIPSSPDAFRTSAGITSGTAAPVDADGKPNGAVYFKTV
jgi:hypothetical protein